MKEASYMPFCQASLPRQLFAVATTSGSGCSRAAWKALSASRYSPRCSANSPASIDALVDVSLLGIPGPIILKGDRVAREMAGGRGDGMPTVAVRRFDRRRGSDSIDQVHDVGNVDARRRVEDEPGGFLELQPMWLEVDLERLASWDRPGNPRRLRQCGGRHDEAGGAREQGVSRWSGQGAAVRR